MEKVRCGQSLYVRDNQFSDWIAEQFPSFAQAKKANGPNSRTVESPKNLPMKMERPEESEAES